MSEAEIVSKVWNYSHVLRDDIAQACAGASLGKMPKVAGVGEGLFITLKAPIEAVLACPCAPRQLGLTGKDGGNAKELQGATLALPIAITFLNEKYDL